MSDFSTESRSAAVVFDVHKFVVDVFRHCRRHNITKVELSIKSGISVKALRELFMHKTEPSLRSAAILATVCNLSLDHYRR